jgi:hypothetical protein
MCLKANVNEGEVSFNSKILVHLYDCGGSKLGYTHRFLS